MLATITRGWNSSAPICSLVYRRRTRIYNTASILIPMAGWKKMSKFAWIFQEIDQIAFQMGNGDCPVTGGLGFHAVKLVIANRLLSPLVTEEEPAHSAQRNIARIRRRNA